jgi:sialic acid synthase SpsE
MLKEIFNNKKPVFIAEIGLNHNGDFSTAENMISDAASAGADAVKFQTFVPEMMYSPYTSSLLKNEDEAVPDTTIIDFFRKFTFTEIQWEKLKVFSEKCGVEFFSAPFDFESVRLLERLKVKLYKIASSELTNIPLLKIIGRTKKPVILSTGMSTEKEIGMSLQTLKNSGSPETVLLHCVSLYPLKKDEANLKRISSLKNRFNVPVGLSDHSTGYDSAVIAAALDAVVFEKHFKLDEKHDCPDKDVSLTPDEFKAMTEKVNEALIMIGDGCIAYSGRENETARGARRSLFAAKKINAGEKITEDSLIALRPGTGISPCRIDELINRHAKVDIKEGSILKIEFIE